MKYSNINWNKCYKEVLEIQRQILKAWLEKDHKKVIKLQRILVESFAARAISVKKVTSNKGGNTPGTDNILVKTEEDKIQLIEEVRDLTKYQPKPIKRVFIPKAKANGKFRPLGIPTIKDRVVQAMYLLTIEPIAEEQGDKRSYGFRKYRSAQDVQKYLRLCLANKDRARYIMDCDIKSFFDNINHEWILKNIPMEKEVIKKWLKVGIIHNKQQFSIESGVPQGGIISPIISNMVLDGLENVIEKYKKDKDKKLLKQKLSSKINFVRYADDFVITADKLEYLKEVKAIIKEFSVIQGGLELNETKTKIYNIKNGFDFLGFNFQKYKTTNRNNNEMLLIKPSKRSILKLKDNIRQTFKKYKTFAALITHLNPILRGWGNYYKYVNSKRIYSVLDSYVFGKMIEWIRKIRGRKHFRIICKEYVHKEGNRNHVIKKLINNLWYRLFRLETINIRLYIMVRNLNPFVQTNEEYFLQRERNKLMEELKPLIKKLFKRQSSLCPVCQEVLDNNQEELEVHHIIRKADGGTNTINNLKLLHKTCHSKVTHTKDPKLIAEYIQRGIIKKP